MAYGLVAYSTVERLLDSAFGGGYIPWTLVRESRFRTGENAYGALSNPAPIIEYNLDGSIKRVNISTPQRHSRKVPKALGWRLYRKLKTKRTFLYWRTKVAKPIFDKILIEVRGQDINFVQADQLHRRGKVFYKTRRVIRGYKDVPLTPPKAIYRYEKVWKYKWKLRRLWTPKGPKLPKAITSALPTTYISSTWYRASPPKDDVRLFRAPYSGFRVFNPGITQWATGSTSIKPGDPVLPSELSWPPINFSAYFGSNGERLDLKAANRLYDDIARLSANLAMYLTPEGAKAAKSVASLVIRFSKLIAHLLTTNPKAIDDLLDIIPSNSKKLAEYRLGWVYGYKPLIDDWAKLQETLSEGMDLSFVAKGSASAVYLNTTENPVAADGYYTSQDGLDIVTTRLDQRFRYTARVRVTSQGSRGANQAGFVDPLPLIWENIPFSFILDWFIKVGDWLNRRSALTGIEVSEFSMSVKEKSTRFMEFSRFPSPRFFEDTSEHRGSGWLTQGRYVRVPTMALPDLPLPQWKSPYSTDHFLNAVALIRTFVR